MQKSLIKPIGRRYDDAAQIVADLYSVTPDYVRKVVKDSCATIYKGNKAHNIRKVYNHYTQGKNNLLKNIERFVKIAS